MNKQTAVDWLVDYFKNLEKYPYKTIQELEEQAKAMEKEQIMDADAAGFIDGCLWSEGEEIYFKSPKDYYEHTYGKGDTE